MSDTHEPCGSGHQKPKGKTCAICVQLERVAKKQQDKRNKEKAKELKKPKK